MCIHAVYVSYLEHNDRKGQVGHSWKTWDVTTRASRVMSQHVHHVWCPNTCITYAKMDSCSKSQIPRSLRQRIDFSFIYTTYSHCSYPEVQPGSLYVCLYCRWRHSLFTSLMFHSISFLLMTMCNTCIYKYPHRTSDSASLLKSAERPSTKL